MKLNCYEKDKYIIKFRYQYLIIRMYRLSETVYTGVSRNNFFKNEKELIANAGRAYTKLQGYNSESKPMDFTFTSL